MSDPLLRRYLDLQPVCVIGLSSPWDCALPEAVVVDTIYLALERSNGFLVEGEYPTYQGLFFMDTPGVIAVTVYVDECGTFSLTNVVIRAYGSQAEVHVAQMIKQRIESAIEEFFANVRYTAS